MATRKQPFSVAALALATSANGTARNAAVQRTNNLRAGIIAKITCAIVTGSVVATFKWQASDDGTTFNDIIVPDGTTNGAVNSFQFAATGTAWLPCPYAAMDVVALRVVATLSGASTAAGDKTQVDYRYRAYDGNP